MRDIADSARAAAFHCEGVLHAFRKTQTGIVVSFALDPADVPQQLALAPLGARYTLALVERGDDERPVSRDPPAPAAESRPHPATASPAVPSAPGEGASRKKYAWRAVMLSRDMAFRKLIAGPGETVASEDEAADYIRNFCHVTSRGEIDGNPESEDLFDLLESNFRAAVGRIAEVRG